MSAPARGELDRSEPIEALAILLVEDEPEIAEPIAEALRREGHRLTVVSHGDRAIKRLDEAVYDLLICDIRLPGADGLSIFRKVREQQPDAKVILMSAYGSVAEAVADSDAPVLITGETGTGKELIARALHLQSSRRDRPFVDVNCAAFQDTLLEAELFGHERGAFTGAERRRDGRFRAADGGTLFLDEVGEMSPSAQAKMLRALQDGTFQSLGSSTTHKVDVRTVAATNVDLRARIGEGRFREDLFYRLKVFHLHVPSLRERRADLPLLAEFFCRQLSGVDDAHGERGAPTITPRAWAALSHYRFPGNVRELKHALRHALVLSQGKDIDLDHLPEEVRGRAAAEPRSRGVVSVVGPAALQPLEAAQRQFEREYLLRALREADWNRTRVAQLLGISRKTLWQKLRRLGIEAGSE